MQKISHRYTEDLRRMANESHDECVSCHYKFKEGDTSHLGYDNLDNPLYVCDKCSLMIKKTVDIYNFMPRTYEIPDGKSKLWRYMDFTKYVSLLSKKSLYFACVERFKDSFEGAKGLKKNKDKWDNQQLNSLRELDKNNPEVYECKDSDEQVDHKAKRLLAELEISGKNKKKWTYINCWHENDLESEAMWRLYSSYLDNAVAVRTSYDRLYDALGRNPSVAIGRVKYIDFRNDFTGINDSFWYKRKSFEHEKEVRAIIFAEDFRNLGIEMNCDLKVLIEEVYVSPNAPDWFVVLVNDVNLKFGINIKVTPSQLNEEPFF